MKLLLITNLYPPQELGGYGRCMADFAWGLKKRGHEIKVICNDAEYLGSGGNGPNGEEVKRILKLKGSFQNGVHIINDAQNCKRIEEENISILNQVIYSENFDGVLLGNIDLIGPQIISTLVQSTN